MKVQFVWNLLDEVGMVQGFLPVFQFSIATFTPPKLHNYLHFNHSLTKRTSERSLGAFPQSNALSDVQEWQGEGGGGIGHKITFMSFLSEIRKLPKKKKKLWILIRVNKTLFTAISFYEIINQVFSNVTPSFPHECTTTWTEDTRELQSRQHTK